MTVGWVSFATKAISTTDTTVHRSHQKSSFPVVRVQTLSETEVILWNLLSTSVLTAVDPSFFVWNVSGRDRPQTNFPPASKVTNQSITTFHSEDKNVWTCKGNNHGDDASAKTSTSESVGHVRPRLLPICQPLYTAKHTSNTSDSLCQIRLPSKSVLVC